MTGLPTKYLILNGSIVILAGLLSGLPFRRAIVRKRSENVNAWRVAHSVLMMDGMWMLVAALVIPHLALDEGLVWGMTYSLVAAGYGFTVAFIVGAWKGLPGLTARPYGLNTLLFAAHVIGASGSLAGTVIMVYGSLRSLR